MMRYLAPFPFPACPKAMTGFGDVILCATTFPFRKFHHLNDLIRCESNALMIERFLSDIKFSGTLFSHEFSGDAEIEESRVVLKALLATLRVGLG